MKNKKYEFSKRIVTAILIIWMAGAIFGSAVTVYQLAIGQMVYIDALLSYIGMPMSGGIVGYLLKSGIENREKISASKNLLKPEE